MLLEHDPSLTALARTLRKHTTHAEQILWNQLRRKQCLGYKFYRQHPVASYIADFYCSKLRLVIELDGEIHNTRIAYDAYRTNDLKAMNIIVIRYTNQQITSKLSRVLMHLKKVINRLSKLPSPPGEEEGDEEGDERRREIPVVRSHPP